MPTKKLFVELLNTFQTNCAKVDKTFKPLENIFCIDWQCNILYMNNALIVKLISELFNISDDWIDWFCFENDFGLKGFECIDANNKKYVINNAEDFWDFIKG